MPQYLKLTVVVTATLAVSAATFIRADRRGDGDRDNDGRTGAVYTMSNDAAGNAILIFNRHQAGTLTPGGAIATGGAGTGAGLGSQGSLVLAEEGQWLLASNAGSNTVSLFANTSRGVQLSDVVDSGGISPISIAVDEDLVYVLNAGSDSISGFQIRRGRLVPLPHSTRALSGAGTGPAEVAFSPDGRLLVVTEKNTNLIDTFRVGDDGLTGPAVTHPSNGATPFGFAFGARGRLFVTEAFGGADAASAVSSYALRRDGSVSLIDGSVATHQTAACWVLLTGDARFAYTTNTGSGSISGYRVGRDGSLALLTGDGRTADTGAGSSPIDLATSGDGRFLYSLNGVTDTIGAFHLESNGNLTPLPFTGGLPDSAVGLAAR
jgi:6-phosphogluconolactonase (cycloisomerase 2 family)